MFSNTKTQKHCKTKTSKLMRFCVIYASSDEAFQFQPSSSGPYVARQFVGAEGTTREPDTDDAASRPLTGGDCCCCCSVAQTEELACGASPRQRTAKRSAAHILDIKLRCRQSVSSRTTVNLIRKCLNLMSCTFTNLANDFVSFQKKAYCQPKLQLVLLS